MTNKRLDLSVLPDGFLIQCRDYCEREEKDFWSDDFQLMHEANRKVDPASKHYRPALNHWNFHDGSMVLPDGLVCHCKVIDRNNSTNSSVEVYTIEDLTIEDIRKGGTDDFLIIGVKVIGVHKDYAKHGKELGMEVIEL